MATYTANYNLKKPAGSENYSVNDQNGNMDKIDAALIAKLDKQGNYTVASGATATVKMNSSFRGLLLAFGVQSGLCGAWMMATNDAASNVGIAVELIRGSRIELTGTNATKTFSNNGSYAVTLYTLCFNGDCTVTVNS